MKKRVIGILVCMLMITTALPAVGTINVGKTKIQEGTTEIVELAPTSMLGEEYEDEADEDWATLEVTVSTNDPPPDKPDKPCGPAEVDQGIMCTYTTMTKGTYHHKICYNFSWGDGTHSGWLGAHNCGEHGEASHKWDDPGNYMVMAKARYEHCHEESEWSEPLMVKVCNGDPPNDPPDKPDKPSGPTRAKHGTMYAYTTMTKGQHQHKICYNFSWGDGTHSGWMGPYECGEHAKASHKWDETGNYMIKAKARYEHCHEESEWSEPLEVTASTSNPPNEPPNTPTITGLANGKVGEEYEYTLETNDPDGDDIYYWVEFCEGCQDAKWHGPCSSESQLTIRHFWAQQGTYVIKVKAKDIYDAESDWATLTVSMPKYKQLRNPLFFEIFQSLLEHFPLLEQIVCSFKN